MSRHQFGDFQSSNPRKMRRIYAQLKECIGDSDRLSKKSQRRGMIDLFKLRKTYEERGNSGVRDIGLSVKVMDEDTTSISAVLPNEVVFELLLVIREMMEDTDE